MWIELETVVHFCESEQAVAAAGINSFDNRAAWCVAKIQTQRNAVGKFIVRAYVVKICQSGRAIGWPPGKSKCPWLVSAAARVPEVVAVGQPQTMNIRAHYQLFTRTQHQLRKQVAVIHFVEKRKTRVNPGCR